MAETEQRLESLEQQMSVLARQLDAMRREISWGKPSLAEFYPHLTHPRLQKVAFVTGQHLRFRPVSPEQDVDFILKLRLDPEKNKHLSRVDDDREAQLRWLAGAVADQEQVYFIIETLEGRSVGTVRLYDVQGSSFSWGSWILTDEAPKSSAVESTLMVYAYGDATGFTAAHFEVRKENEKVWRYHERMGAIRTREDADNFYYSLPDTAWRYLFERYRERLPTGVAISPMAGRVS